MEGLEVYAIMKRGALFSVGIEHFDLGLTDAIGKSAHGYWTQRILKRRFEIDCSRYLLELDFPEP